MQIVCVVGNVVEEPADTLLSTANVQLNMSGGVNGEILLRGGEAIQQELHRYLAENGCRQIAPGTVVRTGPGRLGVKHILHCVAIDAWYESSEDLVRTTIENALARASSLGGGVVATPAMATGYGHLSMREFAAGLHRALQREYPGIAELRIVLRSDTNAAIVRQALAGNTP